MKIQVFLLLSIAVAYKLFSDSTGRKVRGKKKFLWKGKSFELVCSQIIFNAVL